MKCEFELHEYVLVHNWYIPVCTGMYKVLLESREKTYWWLQTVGSDAGCAEWVYGGTQAYKHWPITYNCTCSATSTHQYECSLYLYILVCTWFTKIFLRILVIFDFWQREKILGVVLVYWTGMWLCLKPNELPQYMAILHVIRPLQTQYILVHTGMYFVYIFIQVHTSTYQYILVLTGMYQKPWFCTTYWDSSIQYQNPDENVALNSGQPHLNSGQPHQFRSASQLAFSE